MEQEIRFCKSPDGVRIAYATVGSGYPLVACQGWISHLELDWAQEGMRRFWETLAERFRVVRYDKRGTGLSDRKVDDFSLEAQVGDLAAVVDAVSARKIALLGYSQGGPISIAYTAAHQDTVSHLILYGTYASGSYLAISELADALLRLIDADWGGLGSLAMGDIYMPGASKDEREAFAKYQVRCAEKDAARGQSASVGQFKVKHLLQDIQTPALVLHKKDDKPVPFELGRQLARDLPNSRFVPLDGDSHIITIGAVKETLEAIFDFLTDAGSETPAVVANGITKREAEVLRLIAGGRSNKDIAEELGISVNTVDRHVSNVYTKIGATNRAEAASFAVRNGLA